MSMPSRVDREEFARLHREGASLREIAEILGINYGYARRLRSRFGLPKTMTRPGPAPKEVDRELLRRMYERGHLIKDIAERLQISDRQVCRIRDDLGLPKKRVDVVDPRLLEECGRMLADGASYTEVDRTTGVTVHRLKMHFPGYSWTPLQIGDHGRAIYLARSILGEAPVRKMTSRESRPVRQTRFLEELLRKEAA